MAKRRHAKVSSDGDRCEDSGVFARFKRHSPVNAVRAGGGADPSGAQSEAGVDGKPVGTSGDDCAGTVLAAPSHSKKTDSKWLDDLFHRPAFADFSEGSMSRKVMACRLSAVASGVLEHAVLVVAGKQYWFEEVEVYCHTKTDLHQDPFVHADARQHEFGKFYFHRMGSGYKGGTYKVGANFVMQLNVRLTEWASNGSGRVWTLRLATQQWLAASCCGPFGP
jgi:hypothetical protein